MCKGKCCRDSTHRRFPHKSAEHYWHACAYCADGTVPTPRTAEDERADVLAYLRYARRFPFTYVIDALCDLIEAGQHQGWSRK